MVTEPRFSPGFRISKVDMCVLLAGAIGASLLGSWNSFGGIAVAFVVGHFFLFCNILRMSRPLELIWATVFLALAGISIGLNAISWPVVFWGSGILTVVLAGIELRRPGYHGVGWKRLNPHLPQWWERHRQQSAERQ